ncbi:MAG: hypothetical protein CBC33_006715 [Coraliomargarita sp. TMED73]|nr:MAG: hypothetical protein CBC33_006715 [Coraliomargarita sp. TMED73]
MSANAKILSEWYFQLARHLETGVPFPEAWSLPAGPAHKDRRENTRQLQDGASIADILRHSGHWLPKTDRALLHSAAASGRLPETCQQLAGRHQRLAQARHQIRRKLLYPLLVFHLAALVLPLVRMINFEAGLSGFDLSAFSLQIAALLLPLWSLIALGSYLANTRHPALYRLLRLFPFLRSYAREQSMADFCDVLGSALAVGITPQQAWQQAADCVHAGGLRRANHTVQAVLEKGQDPAPAIAAIPTLPKDFIAYYQTGANSGKLDSVLLDLSRDYELRAINKLTAATAFYPGIALLFVGGMVAYSLFEFIGSYLDLLDSFTG